MKNDYSDPVKIIELKESVLEDNNKDAQDLRDHLKAQKTCLVIAHRLSTVRDADRIAVVDGMHIIEQGSRDELLALGGAYAKLEKAQELA